MRILYALCLLPLVTLGGCDMRPTFRQTSIRACHDDSRYYGEEVSRTDFNQACECAVDQLMAGRDTMDLMSEGGNTNNTAWRRFVPGCIAQGRSIALARYRPAGIHACYVSASRPRRDRDYLNGLCGCAIDHYVANRSPSTWAPLQPGQAVDILAVHLNECEPGSALLPGARAAANPPTFQRSERPITGDTSTDPGDVADQIDARADRIADDIANTAGK